MIKNTTSAAKKHLNKVQSMVTSSKPWSLIDRRSQNYDQRFLEGEYLRITVRPRESFTKFKSDPISGDGMLQQIHGQNQKKQWSTQSWLILKTGAHVSDKQLISDSKSVSKLLRALNGKIHHTSGDNFILK